MSGWILLDVGALLWCLGALVFVLRRRPPKPLWPVLPSVCILALLWVIGDLQVRADPVHMARWMALEYTGLIGMAPATWILGLRFAEAMGSPFRWSRRPWTLLPLAFGAAMWLAMLTHPWHGGWMTPVPGQRGEFHFFWWANGIAMNLEMVAVLILYVRLRRRTPSWLVRRKSAFMIAATITPLGFSCFYVFGSLPPPVDLGIVALLVSSALMMLGIYQAGLFNPLPVATPQVLLDDPTGVILVDTRGFPFYGNRAARAFLPAWVLDGGEDLYASLPRVVTRVDGGAVTEASFRASLGSEEGEDPDCFFRLAGPRDPIVEIHRFPMRTDHGDELGSCFRLHDVTALHHAMDEIRTSEERFRALVENSQDFVAEIDESGHYLYANPTHSSLLGIDPQDLQAGWRTLPVLDEDRQALIETYQKLMATGEMNRETFRFREPGGEVLHIELSGRVFRTASGEKRAVAAGRDVSDRVRTETRRQEFAENMREAQKLESLGVLAGGIAHDFNNLLVPILVNADLLGERATSRETRSWLEEIRRAASSAGDLVSQLLAYAGKGKRSSELFDLSSLARRIGDLLGTAASHATAIHFELAEGLPGVEGDRSQIQQVIINLVTNAAESLEGAPGTITVATRAWRVSPDDLAENRAGGSPSAGSHVALEVRDTGCGIEAKALDRIFEPFFTTKRTGRGLGLAALRGIIRTHRGLLQVASTRGKGTVFRVLLPAASGATVTEQEGLHRSELWRSNGCVLLVDDDPPVRRVGRRLLESFGFRVVCAASGSEALSLFRLRGRDLRAVILDFSMPEMSGDVVLEALRRIDPEIPVIMVSGFSQEDLFERVDVAGLAGFLKKPYTIRSLGEVLRRALNE